MKKALLFLLVFHFPFSILHSQFVGNGSFDGARRVYLDDGAWAPRSHNVDFIHMTLELSFDVKAGKVNGKAIHRFVPLQNNVDSVWVDGPGIKILEASVNGKSVNVRSNDEGAWIMMDKTHQPLETDSMTLVYECTPRHGLYFVGWNDPAGICRKQIWSQGQGIDNRNWIPFYDEMNDKITTDMIVTFDAEYKVLSNGTKVEEKVNKDKTKTWHYRLNKPYAPYLVMLGIGMYDIKETKSKSGVPMHLYYYPDWKDRVETTYQHSEEMIDFYENEIGVKYPWPSYSQIPVQEFMYGAMENVSATVYGDFLFVDGKSNNDRGYLAVNAHELAHQWFGDFVTARSDAHHWLQESFATYYDALFERSIFGEDHFKWGLRDAQNSALAEGEKNDIQVAHSQAGSARHYPKGSFVLNMLKYVVGGREQYNRAVKKYLDAHSYGNVISEDLLTAFEESTGMDLHWFWDEWIYRGGEPEYNVSCEELTISGKHSTRFTVEQSQHQSDVTGLFRMPIWFEVHYADGSMDHQMQWISEKTSIVDIANPSGKVVSYVLFDPNSEILKKVHFKKSFEMLKNQAMNATNMIDRYDAVAAMRPFSPDQKRSALAAVYDKETFHGVKEEVIAQLVNDTDPGSVAVIKKAVADKDEALHKAVINNTAYIRKDMLPVYKDLLKANSYDVVFNTLDKLCFQYPENVVEYLKATEEVSGTSGRNVEIKWLEIKAAMGGMDKIAIDKLVSYTSESYEFRTRVNAAQALKRLDYFDQTMMKNLVNAMFSSNTRLANPCTDVLNTFYGQTRFRKMIFDYVTTTSWNDWQKQILNTNLR